MESALKSRLVNMDSKESLCTSPRAPGTPWDGDWGIQVTLKQRRWKKNNWRLRLGCHSIWSCLVGQASRTEALPGTHHTPTYVCRLLTKAEEGAPGDPDRTG